MYKRQVIRDHIADYSFIALFFHTVQKIAGAFPVIYGEGENIYMDLEKIDVYKRQPYMFASGPVIGVKPSHEYQFRMFVTPVGPYFKGGAKPITICVSDFDRAAPHGTGHVLSLIHI